VLLWACLDADDVLHIVDELVATQHTTEQLIGMANARCAAGALVRPQWIGADPAGHHCNEQTGTTTIGLWKRAGWPVRTRSSAVDFGIKAVRARLRRADNSIGLRISRRCEALIKSLSMYHYPPDKQDSDKPVKDGHDHAADALRYMVVNLDRAADGRDCRNY
jgi:hypothetical protein